MIHKLGNCYITPGIINLIKIVKNNENNKYNLHISLKEKPLDIISGNELGNIFVDSKEYENIENAKNEIEKFIKNNSFKTETIEYKFSLNNDIFKKIIEHINNDKIHLEKI